MKKISYRDAGVDIHRGDQLVEMIKQIAGIRGKGVNLSGIGSFGNLFFPDWSDYRKPVLVTGVDGVGTKLMLAQKYGYHFQVGIDLVAMSANDILAHGAKPLLFFDYLAAGRLEEDVLLELIKGIEAGCNSAGCTLAGGETAEMPDFYPPGRYDLAGFCLGLVEKQKIITGEQIQCGDVLIGLASSGLHSNGFSLVRKLFFNTLEFRRGEKIAPGKYLIEELLKPTRIYVQSVLATLEAGYPVRGLAHITGGGIGGNVSRVISDEYVVQVNLNSWPQQPIYSFIQETELVELEEMFRTFNMGIGYILIVPEGEEGRIISFLKERGEEAYVIGRVIQRTGEGSGSSCETKKDRDDFPFRFKHHKVYFC